MKTIFALAACASLSINACLPAMAADIPVTVEQSSAGPPAPVAPEVYGGLILPTNTAIWFNPVTAIDSRKLRVGNTFEMRVSRDVMIGDTIAIPHGTPATAKITWRTGRGVVGKSAKMEFAITSMDLNGIQVPLSGPHRLEGEGNTMWAIIAWFGAGLIGALLVKGHSAIASEESEFRAYSVTQASLAGAPATATVTRAAYSPGAPRGYASTVVSKRQANTPSGSCYEVPKNYFGTGSAAFPIPNAQTPACWEILEGR